jgi:hypothetical protein
MRTAICLYTFIDSFMVTAHGVVREQSHQRNNNGRHTSEAIGSRRLIFEDDFLSISTSTRGRCKLSDVQRVYTWLLDDYLQKAAQCTRYVLTSKRSTNVTVFYVRAGCGTIVIERLYMRSTNTNRLSVHSVDMQILESVG